MKIIFTRVKIDGIKKQVKTILSNQNKIYLKMPKLTVF